jgi:hypothetical protein
MSRVLAARAFIAKMWRGDAAVKMLVTSSMIWTCTGSSFPAASAAKVTGSTLREAAWALVDIPGR